MDRVEDVARDVTTTVAVIGAGWAGCAAAVALAEAGVAVIVYETGAVPGGRARRVERDGLGLDNGQHLLLGAYTRTLEILTRVHGADGARAAFVRRPLALVPFAAAQADALTLRVRRAPGRLGLLAGLLAARGLSWTERFANLRWFRGIAQAHFVRPPCETVGRMLAPLPPRVTRLLWEPLCLAALNTPIATASAQVFANVLREAFAGPAAASDFLVPATDLSALFPEAALRRSCTGGLPSHDVPALALRGAADRTATRLFLRTTRPGPAMPEFPRKARLPTLARSIRSHPPASS